MTRIEMSLFEHSEKILAFSNGLYIFAAIVTVISTLSVVYFGNRVTALKESQLKAYQKDADVRIAEADAKAAQAYSIAGIANQRAGEANALAERSRLDKEKIEHENLLLQEQLNTEHDARLAIEKRIAQRGINMGEIGTILSEVYPLGTQPIDIVFYKDDAESRILANNLAVVFQEWNITLFEAPGGNSHQVDVEYDPKDEKAAERAKAIFKALAATNKLRMGGPWMSLPHEIQGTGPHYYNPSPAATIRIVVGYR